MVISKEVKQMLGDVGATMEREIESRIHEVKLIYNVSQNEDNWLLPDAPSSEYPLIQNVIGGWRLCGFYRKPHSHA